jgi:peptide/nickel transport system substrate-binding protein
MKRLFFPMVLLLLCALVIAGCSSSSSTSTGTSTLSSTIKTGGTLTWINLAGPASFGYPPKAGPSDTQGTIGILQPLVNQDAQGNPTQLLATAWKTADDGKSVTFTLRQGVKFHDGSPFNAQVVKWNYDLDIKAGKINSVSSVDVVDTYTVKFNLPQFNNAVIAQISDIYMISQSSVDKNGADWAAANAVGTGPFKQGEFVRDASLTKVKYADYWAKGLPYLDVFKQVFIPDKTAARMAFEAGEAQILDLQSDGAAADQLKAKYNIRSKSSGSWFLISDFGNADSPFNKLQVRQALDYAINKKALVDTIGHGYLDALSQVVTPEFSCYNPNIKEIPYDPAKARDLLKQAGYPTGFSTMLFTIAGFTDPAIMTALQGYLNDVGIIATINNMDMGTGFTTVQQGWKNGLYLGATGFNANMCQRLGPDLGATSKNYPNSPRPANWQATLDKAAAAMDNAGRDQYLQQLWQITADNAFITSLFGDRKIIAMDKSVNSEYLTWHPVKWNPADTWINK